ncbi:hypothetical protein COHA_009986 [Chlorella ohadii]|uniref:YqgF/RNase H-like domain-containing protein n=1 Tax=Chlorella ohadii TaxID=2649997 RepID=A0AAD5DG68_9CHLO|nr:hypothetical protein COHA_009986 [Chlorella ohadii]
MLAAAIVPQTLLAVGPSRVQRPVGLREFAPACIPSCAAHTQLQRSDGRMRPPAAQRRLAAAAAWSESDSDDGWQPGASPPPASSQAQQVQRALGLDYGRRVVGLAVSTLGFAPRPLDGLPGCTVHEQMVLAASVLEIARREGCDAVVVGLPVTQRGDLRQRDTDSQQGRRCRNFAENLAAAAAAPASSGSSSSGSGSSGGSLFKSSSGSSRIRVFLADERGSTMQARQELAASGRRKAVVSKVKDSVAAAVILKSFFEDPGAALLVKTGRTRRQPGSRPPPRQQEQQQQQQEQQREQEGQEQGPQQGQQHQEQEQQQAL